MREGIIDWTECPHCDEGYCDAGKCDEDKPLRCSHCDGSGHIEEPGEHCVYRLLSIIGDRTNARLDAAEEALAKVLQAVESEAGQQLPELRLIIKRAVIGEFFDPWLERSQASRRIALINQVSLQEQHAREPEADDESSGSVDKLEQRTEQPEPAEAAVDVQFRWVELVQQPNGGHE